MLIKKRKTVETAEFTGDGRYKRKVRSFVLRTGRLSDFQKNMMNDHWADLGLDYQNAPFDFVAILWQYESRYIRNWLRNGEIFSGYGRSKS